MILSNVEILKAIKRKNLRIGSLTGTENPELPPFNTTSVDLHLGTEIRLLKTDGQATFDLTKPGIGSLLERNTEAEILKPDRPFRPRRHTFVLANTQELIELPSAPKGRVAKVYGARVEGRSSVARCGILIHFTAPTIHPGFGKPGVGSPITLEICNLGDWDFMLYPGMAICQLLIEPILGKPARAVNQFANQSSPTGVAR